MQVPSTSLRPGPSLRCPLKSAPPARQIRRTQQRFLDLVCIGGGGKDAADLARAASLFNYGSAGGQIGVIANATNPLYELEEFVDGGFTTKGIVIKLVHNPNF